MRKLFSIVLAAILVLCLSPPVFAAGQRTEVSFIYAPPGPDYTVEVNGSWTRGSQNGLAITTNAELSKVVGVKVDGILLDAKNYTVVSGTGGTVITLNPEYLETLTLDQHSIELVLTDGSVQKWFTVFPADNTKIPGGSDRDAPPIPYIPGKLPNTGDNSNIPLWPLLYGTAISICGILITGRRKRGKVTFKK